MVALTPRIAVGAEAAAGASKDAGPAVTTTVDPAASAAAAAAAASADETLLLDVNVNGHSTGKIGEFILRHGRLMARAAELRDLGFRVPESYSSVRNDLVPLSDLQGLTWKLDEKNQVLYVMVGNGGLLPTRLQPYLQETAEEHRQIESGSGATLNYDVVNTFASGRNGDTGSLVAAQ